MEDVMRGLLYDVDPPKKRPASGATRWPAKPRCSAVVSCVRHESFRCRETEVFAGDVALERALRKAVSEGGECRIITYTLGKKVSALHTLMRVRKAGVKVIAHRDFADQARALKQQFPALRIRLHPEVHTKLALAAPDAVIIGSANLADGDYHQACQLTRSADLYAWMLAEVWRPLWKGAAEVSLKPAKPVGLLAL
jgi:hypothetical protein